MVISYELYVAHSVRCTICDITDKAKTSGTQADNNKYFAYDTPLTLNADLFRVFTFTFEDEKRTPKKIILSPSKKLILLFGALHRGHSCLMVYQILEEGTGNDFFRLAFYDFSFCFVDACFSSDSRGILTIPAKYPSYVFWVHIPILNASRQKRPGTAANSASPNSPSPLSETSLRHSGQKPLPQSTNYEARKAGPLTIVGPSKGLHGQPLKMTHIVCNTNQITTNGDIEYFHFSTWNDDGNGEYCLWRFCKNSRFECLPRSVVAKVDRPIAEGDDAPKNFILDMHFSCREGKVLIVVRKENYSKKTENGIGMQIFRLETNFEEKDSRIWFQVTDTFDPISCVKWTNTLLLGTSHSAAILIQGKGLFELVDSYFASQFQAVYDTFVEEAVNFIQVGRYHRFWINSSGALRVIVVTPQTASGHPEWNELFLPGRADLLSMRVLGKRVGYFINDMSKDGVLDSAHRKQTQGKLKGGREKDGADSLQSSITSGNFERYCGLHLYRCWNCKRPLLKPLLCSRCLGAVYCSKVCQTTDWNQHSPLCQQKM
eukprot:TRINITY_DN9419_c0_g1_i1.p1 TRINITY_DN9419_c0_g1~~TRINITY_DN9419_c0_g1_i1.p1  ORF type:complete len:545 (+),score=66.26 TRINITY_DN9419_c0_g1_i1:419-2053(+)